MVENGNRVALARGVNLNHPIQSLVKLCSFEGKDFIVHRLGLCIEKN